MAVLIDMEMPERCFDCSLLHGVPFDITGKRGAWRCEAKPEQGLFENLSSRPDWCPLIEIPEPQKGDYKLLEEVGFEL